MSLSRCQARELTRFDNLIRFVIGAATIVDVYRLFAHSFCLLNTSFWPYTNSMTQKSCFKENHSYLPCLTLRVQQKQCENFAASLIRVFKIDL
jgi:hypothetical protein